MKKVTFLFAILSVFLVSTQAQSKFNFFGGYSIPFGEFADTQIKDNGGFASNGYNYGLQLDFFLPSNVGFGLQLSQHKNPFDVDALKSSIEDELGYLYTQTRATGTHSSFAILAEGGYKFVDRMRFTWDVMGGLGASLNSMSQPITVAASKSNATILPYEVSIDYNSKYAFAYSLSTRFIYYVSPSLGISTTISYYGTKPEYQAVTIDTSGMTNKVVGEVNEYSTQNNIIELSLGVVFGK